MGIIVHVDGVIQFANQAAANILGAQASLVGTMVSEWVYPDDLPATMARLRDIGQGNQHRSVDVRVVRGDGKICEIEIMGAITTWDDGPAIQIVFTDITDRKHAVKMAAREQEQALHAQKLESIGRLAGGVAHDFNNILTGILGYTELIEIKNTDNPELLADIREIFRAAQRGATLTQQLLAYSRRQPIVPQIVSPQAAIADIKGLLSKIVGEHVSLEFNLDPSTSPVFVDPGQLDQVILNLVVNGGEAMPEGGRVTVRSRDVELVAGDFVRIDVADQGTGFSPEARHRAFEPFFSTKDNGTGLGLSTVFGVAHQNGGYVEVHSNTPGAMVSFFLPRMSPLDSSRQAPPLSHMGDT